MDAALIGLVGSLVAVLLTAHYKGTERRTALLLALAVFLEQTAACLVEMRSELKAKRIPRAAGNRLKVHIRDYEALVSKAELEETSQAQLIALLFRIKHCLVGAKQEDDILNGHILRDSVNEETRQNLFAALERTAAQLSAEAVNIRANVN